ncbi:MAG: hypothetical protein BGO29_04515 [Bacteroidales bacterium 36-12]|nr:MAG: hypothetical protein BGO29_04515 [Bacteroidales bacterium 36-12]
MNPKELIPNKEYIYRSYSKEPMILSYRYESINHYVFDDPVQNKLVLLHYQQVLKDMHKL